MLGMGLGLVLAKQASVGGGPSPGITSLVSADFKNGVYSIAGVSKTLGEVWEENTDWSAFSPSDVVADSGLTASGPTMVQAVSGPLLASGFVAVLTYNVASILELSNSMYMVNLTDWSTGTYAELKSNSSSENTSGVGNNSTSDDANSATLSTGIIKMAVLFSDTECTASIAGGTNGSIAPDVGTFTDICLDVDDNTLEKIEFFALTDYDAADLPGLSA